MKVELELDKELLNELKEIAKTRDTDLNTLISASLKADLLGAQVFLSEIYENTKKVQ